MSSAVPSVVVLSIPTLGSTTSLLPLRLLGGNGAGQTGQKIVGGLIAIVLCARAGIHSGCVVRVLLRHLQEVGQFARPGADASSSTLSR